MKKPLLMPESILIALGILSAVIFLSAPQLDLLFGELFHKADTGFYLSENSAIIFFYRLVPLLVRLVAIGCILGLVVHALKKWARLALSKKFPHARIFIFLLLALVLGPGLIVNTVFKDNWGRARPRDVIEFGGEKAFTPPLLMAQNCEKNCSFVSGHASIGFYFAAFALLVKDKRRRVIAYSSAVFFGLLLGVVRAAQGGHFLSDTIFSGIFTLLVVHILYRLMFQKPVKGRSKGGKIVAP